MILGLDHLALSVADTEQAKKRFEAEGYSCAFLARNIDNHSEKKPFLTHYQAKHDIGVFKHPHQGMAIEITQHGQLADNLSPYHYHETYISLATPNVAREKHFWQTAFRFKDHADNGLILSSFVPQWNCTLKLVENTALEQYTLDGKGYSCLAFLTNALEKDAATAQAAGATDVTKPFHLIVNGRKLEIVMLRTPGGAICELIQLRKE